MWKFLALAAFSASVLLAQSPDITGVWKADLQKSKFAGPPPTDYLEIIEQKTVVVDRRTQEKGAEIDETTGAWGEHGEQRSLLSFLVTGKPVIRPVQGIPARLTASWEGNTLTLKGEMAGRPVTLTKTYALSSDGQTLTVDSLMSANGREQHIALVLLKQPDAAGEPLRKPEETAEAHFKNVKTPLKTLPASQFLDNMRYFGWALNKDCEFCHVKDHFDSDDKKEKKTARKMIEMTESIDKDNFEGHPDVRCFTCHEGHNRPLSRPLFPDEAARAQANPGGPGQGPGPGPNRPPDNKPPQ